MLPQLEGGWQNKLLFASKYSGPSFYSYIEGGGGGVHSGAELARRLARRFNLVQSDWIGGW